MRGHHTPPSLPAQLRLRMTCSVNEVRGVAQSVRTFLLQQGCSEQDVNDCELALVEACNNAILYATDRVRAVNVEALSRPEEIELRVTDHTRGLVWPERALLPDSASERGRGLFIIQSVMDATRYRKDPSGNTLFLVKRRSRP